MATPGPIDKTTPTGAAPVTPHRRAAAAKASAQLPRPSAGRSTPLRQSPRFKRLTDHLHRLGPRPTGELLLALVEEHDIEADVLRGLEKFARLDPATVARVDGRHWPPPALKAIA